MSLYTVNNFVYVQMMSGEIIPFEISEAMLSYYSILNLIIEYIAQKNDEEEIELERVVFFDENLEIMSNDELVVLGSTYRVFINDYLVRITFDNTVRLIHNYSSLPNKTSLEININNWKAYRYIYHELYSSCCSFYNYVIDGNAFGEQEYRIINGDDDGFLDMLEKYDLGELGLNGRDDDLYFKEELAEDTKIKLIKAYLRECLVLNIEIESYRFDQ